MRNNLLGPPLKSNCLHICHWHILLYFIGTKNCNLMFNGNGKALLNYCKSKCGTFCRVKWLEFEFRKYCVHSFLYIHYKCVLFGLFTFYCYTWAWSNIEQMLWSITGLHMVCLWMEFCLWHWQKIIHGQIYAIKIH